MLGAAPRVGPFSLLVARPYSFLDVGLDFQAKLILHFQFDFKDQMNVSHVWVSVIAVSISTTNYRKRYIPKIFWRDLK